MERVDAGKTDVERGQEAHDAETINKLHGELAAAIDRRHKLQLIKLSFVSTLFGLSGFTVPEAVSLQGETTFMGSYLLYIAPIVAALFDLLVIEQAFSIRRLGCFLRHHGTPMEMKWEAFASRHRSNQARLAVLALTPIIFVSSCALRIGKEFARVSVQESSAGFATQRARDFDDLLQAIYATRFAFIWFVGWFVVWLYFVRKAFHWLGHLDKMGAAEE